MTQVHSIAKALQKFGFPVVSTSPWTRAEDGEIVVSEAVSVQVGNGYLNIVKAENAGTEFRFWPARRSIELALDDLRAALSA